VAEVSGPYTVLEYHMMRASVHKALKMDATPAAAQRLQPGQPSVCVDDSFYILRRGAKRAQVTGEGVAGPWLRGT
jgi:hypothetical protein